MSASQQASQKLYNIIGEWIAPLGYEVVHLETQTGRQNTLRLFIDFLPPAAQEGSQQAQQQNSGIAGVGQRPTIGISDCVRVTKAIDEPLDQVTEVEQIFKGQYELEVSSPGIERPLRKESDFVRYAGSQARVHTFRPLVEAEIGNAAYLAKNPRQKNFLGILTGFEGQKAAPKVKMKIGVENITLPLELISKAHLEPQLIEVPDSTDLIDLKESE